MYRKNISQQLEFPNFYLPFSGQLDPKNRWVLLAQLVPWELAEEIYHTNLSPDQGAAIKSARMALGALLIKDKMGLTDRETVAAIQENPYLQFFIGFKEFTKELPFDASLMVDFRKRLPESGIQKIAEMVALRSMQQQNIAEDFGTEEELGDTTIDDNFLIKDGDSSDGDSCSTSPSKENNNRGKLIVDATCAPADIRFPTDISLMNEAREKNR